MRHPDGKTSLLLMLLVLAGCSPKSHSEATVISGEQGKAFG